VQGVWAPRTLPSPQGHLWEKFSWKEQHLTEGERQRENSLGGKIKAVCMLIGQGEGKQHPRQAGGSHSSRSLGGSLQAGICEAAQPPDPVSLPTTPRIDKSTPTGAQLICFPSIDPCGKSPLAAAPPASSSSLFSALGRKGSSGLVTGERRLGETGDERCRTAPWARSPSERDLSYL